MTELNSKRFYKSIFQISICAAMSILALAACSMQGTIQSVKQESLYDRVIRTGKIRCSYFVYNPICIKDPVTGKLSGIGVDALELVAKKLGLTVEYGEEVGLETLIEGLKTRRYDLCVTPICAN